MKFDLFSLVQQRDASWSGRRVYETLAEHVRLAEQIGLETAWFAEHHFNNYSLCPSPLLACAYFAGMTRRIRLGTAVLVLPFYEPARVIEEIAQADLISNGRLVVGIGSGYQDYEFQRFRVPLDEAIDRTLEILDMIELGLTRETFAYDGRHYRLPPTTIAVRPVQAMPEIWVAGLHPKVQERAARSGYVPLLTPSWNPIASLAKVRQSYDETCRKIGRDPATLPLSLMRFIHVTDSKAEARDAAERARYSSRLSLSLRLNYGQVRGIYADEIPAKNEPPIEEMERNYIIGDAQTCIERILEDQRVMRHSHVLCNLQLGGVPQPGVMRTLEALGSTIIPAVDKEFARRGTTFPEIRQRPLMAEAAAAQ
jgi:alkanesulfonate monooxygenase SsuD/methylene tetrahydromethanopterin reductase-like flavin-dependent oxidoreductase (luciferase family)